MITEEIKQITKKIKETLEPERIYLFGSYARNQETEASDYDFYDYDFYVVGKKPYHCRQAVGYEV